MMIEGRVLGGRYQIQDKIGSGGMAAVFRGIDNVLGRTVAIKVMLPQYASDPTFAARFRQEAQAAAALTSPYIVSVYDWGQDGDTYYIVMEYIRGTDLKSGIRTHGALAPRKVAQIGAQVCAALSVAHKHEIIHRDIKPQNIMIQPDGTAKVMDFGIARAKNSHLTQTNSVLGTAHYVSPEQTQGKELGAESDLYSLGVVMYEAVTGQVPFDGDEAITVALKHVNEKPVAPSERNSKVDDEFEAIILKCMQKDPSTRFHSADELRRVLNNYIAGRPTGILSASQAPTTVLAPGTSAIPAESTRVMPSRPQANRVGMGGAAHSTAHIYDTYNYTGEIKRKPVWPIIVGALAAIVVIALAVVFLLQQSSRSLKTVPNLIGYDEIAATKAIEQAGFVKGDVSSSYSNTAKSGTVIDQDPDQGIERATNTKINIVLSKGPAPKESVLIPNIVEMDQVQAEKTLREKKLVPVGGGTAYDDKVPAGKIISQNPVAGSKAVEGDQVSYIISLGTENKNIPNVVGKKLDDAKSELEAAGFKVESKEDYSYQVEAGRVISQSPESGSTAAKDSVVKLVVSKGGAEVATPNVVGMSKDRAVAALHDAGFKVSVEESVFGSSGKVISQEPRAGESIKPGSKITITVEAGPYGSSGGSGGDSSASSSSGSGNGGGFGN